MCTVSVTTVTLKGAGDCMIEATQPGNGTWDPAIPVDQTFHVAQATLTVTASSPADGAYGDAAPAVTPGYSGFVSPDGPGSLTAEPTCTTAYAKGDAPGDYATSCSGGVAADYAFSFVDGTFHVAKASQSIDFSLATVPAKTYGDGAFDIASDASATSGLPVAFGAQTAPVCTVSGSTVTIHGAGDCTIRATQAGDANHAPASHVDQTFNVAKAAPACAVTGYSVTYDGTAHVATGSCLALDGVTHLAGLDLSATSHTGAGSHPADAWTFTDVTGNYAAASGIVSDAIAKATPAVQVTGGSVAYDGSPHAGSGFAYGVGVRATCSPPPRP